MDRAEVKDVPRLRGAVWHWKAARYQPARYAWMALHGLLVAAEFHGFALAALTLDRLLHESVQTVGRLHDVVTVY